MHRRFLLLTMAFVLLACLGCHSRNHVASDSAGKGHSHPNSPQGTIAALDEMRAAQSKAFADVHPIAAPQPCAVETKNVTEIIQTNPGSDEAAKANLELMNCTMKVTNEARCKGKAQPCGLVAFNPPIKPNEPAPPAQLVDVSVPSQVSSACQTIGAAAGVTLTAGIDPAVGVALGSAAGDYSCGAYFDAAAKHDPMLLVAPQLIPTVQLTRDLKQLTGGTVDLTPEEAAKNIEHAAQRSLVTVKVGSVDMPVAFLPTIPLGGTPGKVLDDATSSVQKGVNHLGDEIGRACKNLAGFLCH